MDTPIPYAKGSKSKLSMQLLYRSWWVFVFVFFSLFLYSHAAHKKKLNCMELENQLASLQFEKEGLMQRLDDLRLQIHSQNDPAWVRLTLMKGMGMVPEGQLKVYFQSDAK